MLRALIASGDPVVASNLQEIFKSFINPGVVRGCDLFVVNNNTLGISGGACLTDSGVFLMETEVRQLTVEQTISAKDYTIIYKYIPSNDFGGAVPSLQLVQGLLTEETFSDGVILGWVKYTGGSAPLAGSMLIPATKITLQKPLQKQKNNYQNVMAPLSSKWVKKTSTGPVNSLVVNEYYDATLNSIVTQVTNTGATIVTAEYVVPFAVDIGGAGQLMVDFAVSTAASVNLSILTESGASVTPITNVPVFTNKAMAKEILTIPAHAEIVFGKVIYVRFSMNIQPNHDVKIKRLGVSSYMEPV